MLNRTTVRTVVTLVAALGVATMFAGSAAAIDLGGIGVGDSADDAPVEINTGLDTEASQSGGGGGGNVSVDGGPGSAAGNGSVEVDAESQSVTVAAAGSGGPDGNEQSASVECTIDQDSVTSPQEACETPGGDGLPEPPVDELPDDELPELPGDELPELPDDELPELPVDGLTAI